MEESSSLNQNGGQTGPQTAPTANNKQTEETQKKIQYSIPGVLHFIQHEWAKFELERSQWEVDRAELQARIAFLQGERKGQENLKNDLVRRIKMLEYALKQERANFHKLKYGTELQQGDMKPPLMDDSGDSQLEQDQNYVSVTDSTWKQGRHLLRQYLQEIGYTDRIIDVRSTRVRALLGLNNNNADQEENLNGGPVNGNESNKRVSENEGRRTPVKKTQPRSMPESMMLDTEAAVMANLNYLSNADVEMEDDDDISDDVDMDTNVDEEDIKQNNTKIQRDDVDTMALDVFNELNRLSESEKKQETKKAPPTEWDKVTSQCPSRPIGIADEDNMDGSMLKLGDLAELTVNNEAETTYDIACSKEALRKTWNTKYTLRSHFDGVRALAFHPIEPVLITASEDNTLKLWNLQKPVSAKKSASLDVEPLYTFRSHTGPVLSLVMSGSGEHCYSGGLDGVINCWNVPNSNIDPYDLYEPYVLNTSLNGHSDAVWGLSVLNSKQQLVSSSADGTVKLWSPHNKVQLLNTFASESDGIPTSVDFVRDEPNKIVASFASANCVIFDAETGKQVVRFEASNDAGVSLNALRIYKLVCHPTLPLTITAHEDKHIRFWDNHTGKLVHSMVTHLDAVTCLAVDPNGLYVLSGSHDCSIRLWHLDKKTCVQEMTVHRKKFDESILDVAFHPSRPYIASAGADGLAKVFV
ncbi:hypothetical protein D910_06703 [Dendroctonus ponderosae]|uniref:Striatin N-terminal domain-containing protein n=2 Tax=Dendroctonus ponderosae TaxID=77166 RepID=U4UFJ6_DENPD|nr:hypothetical protein D910_06703 [Dendroctonus ponderosae]